MHLLRLFVCLFCLHTKLFKIINNENFIKAFEILCNLAWLDLFMNPTQRNQKRTKKNIFNIYQNTNSYFGNRKRFNKMLNDANAWKQ